MNSLFSNRISKHGAQYITFAIFGCIAYSIPFFMMSFSNINSESDSIFIRFLASILCFILLLKDYWPSSIKKYLPIYWYFSLTFCLPFFISYMLLLSNLNIIWIINMSLGLFLLSALVDWKAYILIILLGGASGALLYQLTTNYQVIEISSDTSILCLYVAFFSILIGLVFTRNKEFIQQQVVSLLTTEVSKKTTHLTKALQVKKDFLNNMSHEIRTPLQGILGISESLVDSWEDLSDKQRLKYLQDVVNNGQRLRKLVSNLLDMSKFDSGKMSYDMQYQNLEKLISEVIKEFSNYKIPLTVIKNTHTNIRLDPIRISQVVRNLISNAIKFGNNNNIEITIEDCNYDINHNKDLLGVKVSITDKGIGIPKNELEHIFLPFTESSLTKNRAGGTGLGLSISQEIIKAHTGIIKAESTNNTTCFSFILPRNKVKIQESNDKQLNILLVDDEDTCLTACSLILFSLGHKVIIAEGGAKGLDILKTNNKFDLILLDLMMPDIYGINVLKKIKTLNNLKYIPVIIQSGIADEAEIRRAYNHGASGFIPKPYKKDEINKAIKAISSL